jgi:serine protease Do
MHPGVSSKAEGISPDRHLQRSRAMLCVVKRSLLVWVPLALGTIASRALAQPPKHPALPPLPASETSASGASATPPAAEDRQGATTSAAASAQQLYEHLRRGVVALERNGVPLAIGTVLGGDGRILTSWSGLGGLDATDIRYADGTTVHAKVGHGDKAADLALLVPQSRRWTEGLVASESDPVGAPLRAMLPARGASLGPAEAGIRGRVEAHARDGEPLLPMLDVDVKGPLVAGAPLLDAAGGVVAVLVRTCKGPSAAQPDPMPWAKWAEAQQPPKAAALACTPVVVGAPVSAIRRFLVKAPATAVPPAPWLGIRGEPAQSGLVHGVRVVDVAPSSPAQKSGLKADADIIVAADGRPIPTPEKLADTIGKHAPGEAVKLLVFGEDKFREVVVTLRAAP